MSKIRNVDLPLRQIQLLPEFTSKEQLNLTFLLWRIKTGRTSEVNSIVASKVAICP